MKKALYTALQITLATTPVLAETAEQHVNKLADDYLALYYTYQPEEKTYRAMPDAEHERLNPNSQAALKERHAAEDALWEKVKSVDSDSLIGTPAWITYGFLHEAVEGARATRVCRFGLWPISHLSGWQVHYPNIANAQPVDTDELRARALQRWQGLPAYIDTEINNLKHGLDEGYSTPKMIVTLVIEQLDNLLAMPVADSPFSAPTKKEVPDSFRSEWLELVETSIYPTLKRYRTFLSSDYLSKARTSIAITAHPNGDACYRAAYKANTTLDRTAKEVFKIGSAAVAANQKKLIALGKEAFGLTDPDAIRSRLKIDPQNRFGSREEILEQAEEIVARSLIVSKDWFGHFPKGDVVVEAIPTYEEKSVTASYRSAAKDGSKPARYMINLHQPTERMKSQGEVTAIHEAYPGHHLQIAIGQEQPTTHPITQVVMNGGFVEGWARYSEALADEMGLFNSYYARIGRLSWPARGMVADGGIHGMGWTNEQAINFMDAAGTLPKDYAKVLLARIAVWPGQLASYDTGGLEIFALRELAEKELGDKFNIKTFHDRVLESGSVTLPMLRTKIENWIKSQK